MTHKVKGEWLREEKLESWNLQHYGIVFIRVYTYSINVPAIKESARDTRDKDMHVSRTNCACEMTSLK